MTGIIYGTTMGNTEDAANIIANNIEGETKVVEVSTLKEETIADCDVLLLGSSTNGFGELQDDWEVKIDELKKYDLKNKKIGFFALGDQESYPDSFVGAMGELYEAVKETGAELIGSWPVDGYDFTDSTAVVDGKFIGLALDEDNQSDLTEQRIADWVKTL